jgi:ketosteroid isomerase-like protein
MSEESTTPDLVGLTRRNFEAANRRDFDAALSFYAPDAVWDTSPMGLGTHEGLATIRGFFEDWIDAYDEFEVEPEEILDLGNGVVFVVICQHARLVGSTGHVQQREAWVSLWADGAFLRTTTYPNIDEARAAAERLAESRE